MKKALMKIIDDSNKINQAALKKHTRWFDAKKVQPYQLKAIQHLYMINDASVNEDIPAGCYLSPDGTWLLILNERDFPIGASFAYCGDTLELLNVENFTQPQIDLAQLTNLKDLEIHSAEKPCMVTGLSWLNRLESLELRHADPDRRIDFSALGQLRSLTLSHVSDDKVGDFSRLENLEHLTLFELRTIVSLDVSGMKNLRGIGLSYCQNLHNIVGLSETAYLEHILLIRVGIRRLPEEIRNLRNLGGMLLHPRAVDDRPDWLPELGLSIGTKAGDDISLPYTTVQGVDMSIFDQSQEVILKWFEERKKAKEANAGAPLNEAKVVFLGDGEAGKTHTITRLLKGGALLEPGEIPEDATPGIVITDKPYDLGDRTVQVHFWDFGGQEILHSMHRIFLTERTLYVVLLNARDNTKNERARYWLHNIRSFAGNAPVLLVLNKTDQNEHATVNISDLREICPGLPDAVHLSALRDSPAEFNRKLTGAMLDAIRRIDTINTFFPNSWKQVKDALQTMKTPYIKGDAYKRLCDDNRVDSGIQRDVLDLFKTLGVSFYYPGAKLEDYVVLRPDWITNAIYIILFNKREEVKNGLISHETIYRLLNPRAGDSVKRVLPDATYNNEEVAYVLDVVRRFRLSYLVEDGVEFIPMLCGSNSLPVAAEYAADEHTLEFRMVYDYLPNNVIHRLMVELRQHLDQQNVWLTGALFRETSKGFSAVVKTEGNLLRIFVRAEKPRYTADMYLDTIRDALERINAGMGLQVAENQVVYKADGIVECFDYDDLLLSQELGDTTVTSRVRRKKVPIADILSQTDHRVDEAREALIGNVLSVCRSLQANEIYWKAKEDDRNTYIRDMLKAKGYIVADQTRSGISAGGKQAGELDLDIRREGDIPWTIFEALNLSGKGATQIAYWDDHLTKLLDNYNANGLPFLLHVSYVECAKNTFSTICTAYAEHMRFHSPAKYPLQFSGALRTSPEGYGENQFIRAYQCVYDCDGFPTTVYHFFVHMGS